MNHDAELAALKAQVQSLEQLQDLLLYTVTHELRTPVMTIMGFADLTLNDVKAQASTTQLLPSLERIRAAAERQGQMIHDLQRIATIAKQPLQRGQVNFGDLLRELLNNQPAPAVQISACSPALADSKLMKIALESLLKIASKLAERATGTVIEFAEQQGEKFVVYTFRIGGTGFDLGADQSLSGMFRRLQAGNEYAGAGIALLEVIMIIQRHAGTVWISTTPDMEVAVNFTVQW
jgi:light-regulated signal transduction histidine kinase (bacteriophytochrome)